MKFISSTNKSTTRSNARFLSFLCGEVGDFAFLGFHASSVVSYLQTSGTTYCLHFQRSSSPRRKIMGLTCLPETLAINDELWMKSRSLLRIYKLAVNSDDNKWSTKCRKYRMDCFALVILMMCQNNFLFVRSNFDMHTFAKIIYDETLAGDITCVDFFKTVKTFGDINFFPVALRSDSGSWLPLTELRDPLRCATLARTSLDEWSDQRVYLYLTTHNTHKRQTSMLSARFDPTIPASEQPQTHALDRAATGIGNGYSTRIYCCQV